MSEKISTDDVTRFIKQKLGITVANHYDKSLIIVVIYRFLLRFSKKPHFILGPTSDAPTVSASCLCALLKKRKKRSTASGRQKKKAPTHACISLRISKGHILNTINTVPTTMNSCEGIAFEFRKKRKKKSHLMTSQDL
jgi:hypothetical protein